MIRLLMIGALLIMGGVTQLLIVFRAGSFGSGGGGGGSGSGAGAIFSRGGGGAKAI